MFKRLREGLKKTRDKLKEGLTAVLSIGRDLDDQLLDDLEEALYTADLGSTGTAIIEDARRAWKRREVKTTDDVYAFLKREIRARLGDSAPLRTATAGPTVVLVVGVNGCGKTTSI
ncbi:MAG: signal recognition particle receptor subunit alpha, partial [Planctomycetota bacterium JB042]